MFRHKLSIPIMMILVVGLALPGVPASTVSTHAEALLQPAEMSEVVAWGCGLDTDYGQCDLPAGLTDVISISASHFHSLALKSDGTVVAWGCGSYNYGQCNVPAGLIGVTAIAAGATHSLALKSDGTVVAWGCGPYHDAGQCVVPTGLDGVTAIAAGGDDSFALKSDGTVMAWGSDYRGVTDVPDELGGVIAIAAADFQALALKTDGKVVAWGCGGDSDHELCNVPAGLNGVMAIAAGIVQSVALKSDGTVMVWGCGDPSSTIYCAVPEGLSGVTAIAAGGWHGLALKNDGMVVGWGGNGAGEASVPPDLGGVTRIAAGGSHSLALRSVHHLFLPCVSHPCLPLYSDDFNNPASGWEISDDPIYSMSYAGGEYRILIKQANWVVHDWRDFGASDYRVEVDARPASHLDGEVGLIFGASSAGYYLFEINDGWFHLLRRDSGSHTWVRLIDWTPSAAIRGGFQSNHLKVARSGASIMLYANDQLLATANDGSYISGGLGMATTAYSDNFDGRFDNFVVWTDSCAGVLSPATTNGAAVVEVVPSEPGPGRARH